MTGRISAYCALGSQGPTGIFCPDFVQHGLCFFMFCSFFFDERLHRKKYMRAQAARRSKASDISAFTLHGGCPLSERNVDRYFVTVQISSSPYQRRLVHPLQIPNGPHVDCAASANNVVHVSREVVTRGGQLIGPSQKCLKDDPCLNDVFRLPYGMTAGFRKILVEGVSIGHSDPGHVVGWFVLANFAMLPRRLPSVIQPSVRRTTHRVKSPAGLLFVCLFGLVVCLSHFHVLLVLLCGWKCLSTPFANKPRRSVQAKALSLPPFDLERNQPPQRPRERCRQFVAHLLCAIVV